MSNRSIHLRSKLDRLDEIPTTVTAQKRDRRSYAEAEESPEKLDIHTRKTQSFGAGNTRTPPPPRISVSIIEENKVFEVQKSGTMQSGGFERNATAQNSANHDPHRKTSKTERPLSTGMGTLRGKKDESKVFEVQRSGTMEFGGFERNATAQNSANHNPYRKTNKMERPLSTSLGADNPGFATSRGSSMYGGSLGSLPIIREQYCCWARWTKRERMLFAIIGILGFAIVCLLVTVGSLLGINNDDKPICLPNLYFGRCAETEPEPEPET